MRTINQQLLDDEPVIPKDNRHTIGGIICAATNNLIIEEGETVISASQLKNININWLTLLNKINK